MFEAVYTEVTRKVTRIQNIKYEEIDPETLEKGTIDVKLLMKNQSFVSDGPLYLLSYY